MENEKLLHTVLFGIGLFFYSLFFYFCSQYIIILFGFKWFDTIFMMSSYTLVIGVIIYFINYDKINVLFKNKKNRKYKLPTSVLVVRSIGKKGTF